VNSNQRHGCWLRKDLRNVLINPHIFERLFSFDWRQRGITASPLLLWDLAGNCQTIPSIPVLPYPISYAESEPGNFCDYPVDHRATG